jgi:hypothetical protein
VATFDSGEQREVEDVTEHVKPQLSRIIGKRPINVAKPKTL